MALQFNRLFERHAPSINKIYTYNLLRENVSFATTREANEFRDVGHIARIMDFLVRGRQLQYASAQKIMGKIHERKDMAQYEMQKQTFIGGTPCKSVQVTMNGLGKIQHIKITRSFARLDPRFQRDFYVSAYFQALTHARNQLFEQHLKINKLAVEELYEELNQFESVRDAQRRDMGALGRTQAIQYQYELLQKRYETLSDAEFEKIYGRSKQAMTPDQYPEHELLDMYMSRSYLNTAVPVTPIEESIGPMNDPLSAETILYQRVIESESSADSLDKQMKMETEQRARLLYSLPSELLPSMMKKAAFEAGGSSMDSMLRVEEMKTILQFDQFLQNQRTTMFQLLGGMSDETIEGYDDPTYSMVTKDDIIARMTDHGAAALNVKRTSGADYDPAY